MLCAPKVTNEHFNSSCQIKTSLNGKEVTSISPALKKQHGSRKPIHALKAKWPPTEPQSTVNFDIINRASRTIKPHRLLLLAQVFILAHPPQEPQKPQPQKWKEHQTPPRSPLANIKAQAHQIREAKDRVKARPAVNRAKAINHKTREADKSAEANKDKIMDKPPAGANNKADSNKDRIRAVANRGGNAN
ncbi:uncharacterized protein LOC143798075 [Ranitomeya variabilis]|uniref:uncharacterized protein LOC143798075 n=1 Tax=Ranitomeya variabilis TaxID=490064 RepID=UPI0040570726